MAQPKGSSASQTKPRSSENHRHSGGSTVIPAKASSFRRKPPSFRLNPRHSGTFVIPAKAGIQRGRGSGGACDEYLYIEGEFAWMDRMGRMGIVAGVHPYPPPSRILCTTTVIPAKAGASAGGTPIQRGRGATRSLRAPFVLTDISPASGGNPAPCPSPSGFRLSPE